MVTDARITEKDFDKETIEKFKVLAVDRLPSIRLETSTNTILEKLNLVENNNYKRAAIVLFGKNPQKFYPQAVLKIGKFITEAEITSSDLLEGNLFQQAEKALAILSTKYLIRNIKYEGIHRRDLLEFPYEALREGIFNALIHRDYNSTSSTQVRVYKQKLVIVNEGNMPNEVSIEDLKKEHFSKPGNILLADVFYKAGFIESWGSGTLKILNQFKTNNLPEPIFEENKGVIKLTFRKVSEKVSEKLSQNQKEILKQINKDRTITVQKMSEKIGIAKKSINYNLKQLKEKGLIERIGSAKGGYWKIINNE